MNLRIINIGPIKEQVFNAPENIIHPQLTKEFNKPLVNSQEELTFEQLQYQHELQPVFVSFSFYSR